MNPLLLVVASVAVGIDYGYQPLESGGLEYIIQFEPQQLDALNEGMDLVSEVPPDLDIRRYRIQVGTDKLPRNLGSQARRRGVGNDAAARRRAESAADEVASEPAKSEFETTGDASAHDQADADQAEGPALVADPAGTDKTFSSDVRGNPFAAGSFLDGKSPGKFQPDEKAGPLLGKSIAAAGYSDRAQQLDNPEGDEDSSYGTRKPAISDTAKSRTKAAADSEVAEAEKPWMTLVWTIAALCVSLGLNVYLGWIAWTARERYRLLLERSPGEPVEV